MLSRVITAIVALLALPASSEPIGWRVPVADPVDTFELCDDSGAPCRQIGYSRWHAPLHADGDTYVYRADVELAPGVRAWVRGVDSAGAPVEPSNPARIWCSPWDFGGDGVIGAGDFATYLWRSVLGRELGGAPERANLLRVFAETCR